MPSTAAAPLPTEMPAAALWWRLAGTLAPPTLARRDTMLRPPWTAELHHLFGTAITEIIVTDTAWPGLVAAVTASGWPPADLLAAASEHLRDLAATDAPPRPDQYAQLLTYRVELLTQRAATIDQDIPHPADYSDHPAPSAGDQLAAYNHDLDQAGDLHEPPPDPLDYHVDDAHHELAGLDFDDLPAQRPPTIQTHTNADIAALRARRNTAHRRARQLAAAILGGAGGPAEQAAAAQMAELHRQLSDQRPHQHALARAHASWVQAEDTAELHHRLLNQLTAAATAATERGDHDTARDYHQQHDRLTENTPRVHAATAAARDRLDAARAELIATVGGLENLITEQRIHTLRAQATDRRHRRTQRRPRRGPRPRSPAHARRSRRRASVRRKPRPQLRTRHSRTGQDARRTRGPARRRSRRPRRHLHPARNRHRPPRRRTSPRGHRHHQRPTQPATAAPAPRRGQRRRPARDRRDRTPPRPAPRRPTRPHHRRRPLLRRHHRRPRHGANPLR